MRSIVIFVGPTAVGKSFAASTLVAGFPDHFERVKAYTTRARRETEKEVNDRIFISNEEFSRLAADGQFGMHDYFAGNGYGYHHEDLGRTDKHLIINGPSFFVHKFLELQDILIIGLQAPRDYMTLLAARMRSRGEPPEVQTARQTYIQGDINDLEKLRATINKHGKVFRIQDDRTVPDEVLPWIIQKLGVGATRSRK